MRYFFIILVLLQCILLAGLGFLPSDQIPYHEILPQDKVLHFSGFFLLTFLTFFIWDRPRRIHNILMTAIPIGVLAFASEILQPVISPTRAYDGHDILSNIIGSIVGLTIALVVDRIREKRYSRSHIRYEAIGLV